MKSNYTGLWLLLTLALSVIVSFSFSDDFSVGGWTIKKAPVAETLFTEPDESALEMLDCELLPEQEIAQVEIEIDSVPKNIFLFGDSMTFNLALRLAKYAKQNGHQFHAVNWDSSNTKIWAETDTLSHYLTLYKPDYIFISLGSNEVYFKNPSTRLPYVKKILERLGDTPYVWIGQPNWNEDTGINDMLESTCKNGSFFRSQGMEFKRKKDKIHPTRESSALWIDSIMRWMPKSSHPILASEPSDSIGKVNANVVFLKALNK